MPEKNLIEASAEIKKLYEASVRASKSSYSPYSEFRVGAVAVTSDGTFFEGTNVENVSYSLCMCAERNAIFQAVMAKQIKVTSISVYVETERFPLPCGACLQVMTEFMSLDSPVYIFNKTDKYISEPLSYFIPHPFDRSILLDKKHF